MSARFAQSKDYKKAVEEFTKHGSKLTFRTTELAGVKIAAVEALGELGDTRAVDPLMDILEESGDLSLRKPAVKSLARLVEFSRSSDDSTERVQALREKIAEGRLVPVGAEIHQANGRTRSRDSPHLHSHFGCT